MHLNDVERTLRDQGFLLDRVRGSHGTTETRRGDGSPSAITPAKAGSVGSSWRASSAISRDLTRTAPGAHNEVDKASKQHAIA